MASGQGAAAVEVRAWQTRSQGSITLATYRKRCGSRQQLPEDIHCTLYDMNYF